MNDIEIIHGDCREVMAAMPAGSVDAIVTDPPYFRIVNESWDRQWSSEADYLDWLGGVADEWQRLLRPNGSLYCFASPRMAAKVELLIGGRFRVINSVVWRKDSPCKSLVYGPENFRGFVEMSERIIFAEHAHGDVLAGDGSGYAGAFDSARRETFGVYLEAEITRSGFTRKSVAELFPSRTGNPTGCVSNWVLGLNSPTPDQYEAIRAKLNSRGGDFLSRDYDALRADYDALRADYDALRADYDALRRPFAVTKNVPFSDVWDFAPPSRTNLHPCEKPLPLLMHMLNVSTRPGDTVLDPFTGSGSTLVACQKTGRRGIGIELDPKYIPVIRRRVSEARTPLFEIGA